MTIPTHRPNCKLLYSQQMQQFPVGWSQMPSLKHAALSRCLDMLRSACRLQTLQKRLSASWQQAKANRLHNAIADAHQAALRHDTGKTAFAIIRRLTPRQPFRAIRSRVEKHCQLLKKAKNPLIPQKCAPKDIRPIALTYSVGKTILGFLIKALKAHQACTAATADLCLSFLPARGTLEALCMCVNIAVRLDHYVRVLVRLTGEDHRALALFGSLLLSLDMSQAFDRLPSSYLAQGFDMFQVDPSLSQLFSQMVGSGNVSF